MYTQCTEREKWQRLTILSLSTQVVIWQHWFWDVCSLLQHARTHTHTHTHTHTYTGMLEQVWRSVRWFGKPMEEQRVNDMEKRHFTVFPTLSTSFSDHFHTTSHDALIDVWCDWSTISCSCWNWWRNQKEGVESRRTVSTNYLCFVNGCVRVLTYASVSDDIDENDGIAKVVLSAHRLGGPPNELGTGQLQLFFAK